jgi:chitin disaccharide deacetylase
MLFKPSDSGTLDNTDLDKRWCIFTSAGDNNAVRLWSKDKVPRRWDLVVAYYGNNREEFSKLCKMSTRAFRSKGGKFQNLKKFVTQNRWFFDKYSYVWVCDDDIQMSAAQIDEAFAIAELYEFWIAQPVFRPEGKNSHSITTNPSPKYDYRIVNFIEVGVPIFRRDKLLEFLNAFDGNLAGFGIDFWYMNLFRLNTWDRLVGFFTPSRVGRFAIIDRVQVLNPYSELKGQSEIDKLQPRSARMSAWLKKKAERNLVEFRPKVLASCKISSYGDARIPVRTVELVQQLAINFRSEWNTFKTRGANALMDLRFQISRHLSRIRRPTAPAILSRRSQTLAEQLGYDRSARLLIVHADDVGIAHSVNAAFFDGLQTGLINSGSVMVPCPWFPEAAQFARARPEVDLGIHLTLTSERTACRWRPTAPLNKVRSLVDQEGYFHRTWLTDMRVNSREIEIELRAQIERAYSAGLHPTHLDSHQARLQMNGPRLLELYLRLGRERGLPVFIARDWLDYAPLRRLLSEHDVIIDHTATIGPEIKPRLWSNFYRRIIESLKPGVTQIVIHPGLDSVELRALTADREAWGAAWRQRDFDFFVSGKFRTLLSKNNIILINWREIGFRFKQRKTVISSP